jgi:hypothetical protein
MDDEELLTVLRGALAAEGSADESVEESATIEASTRPDELTLSGIVEAGRAAWSWRTIDEELAELAYDSADRPALAGLRGGTLPPRQLTFEYGALRLELEVGTYGLLGQVLPPQPVHVQVRVPDGSGPELDSDGQGRFVVEPALTGPVQLRCSPPDADPLVTGWVLL